MVELNTSVRVDDVKLDMLREHYTHLFSKEPGKKSKQVLLKEVLEHYTSKAKSGMPFAHCPTCGADSDAGLDQCPLCGAGDTELDSVTAEIVGDKPKKGKKNELVAADKVPVEKHDVADLDREVQGFFEVQKDVSKNYWGMGKHLKEIQDKQLWRLRKSADGLPQYTSFTNFVKGEIGWSLKSATNAIRICETYTPAQIESIGRSKLGILLQMNEEERSNLLDSGEASKKTTRQLKESNDDGEKPVPKPSTTIVFDGTSQVIALYAKDQPKGEDGPTKLADEIDDKPWGKLVSQSGLEVMFVVKKNRAGHLELHLSALRDD